MKVKTPRSRQFLTPLITLNIAKWDIRREGEVPATKEVGFPNSEESLNSKISTVRKLSFFSGKHDVMHPFVYFSHFYFSRKSQRLS